MRTVAAGTLLLALCGCQTQPTDSAVTQCAKPRPQVCTMEYAPVCATGIQGGEIQYSSGCNACADDAIAGYILGACVQ